jgi:hypothetical protein
MEHGVMYPTAAGNASGPLLSRLRGLYQRSSNLEPGFQLFVHASLPIVDTPIPLPLKISLLNASNDRLRCPWQAVGLKSVA